MTPTVTTCSTFIIYKNTFGFTFIVDNSTQKKKHKKYVESFALNGNVVKLYCFNQPKLNPAFYY